MKLEKIFLIDGKDPDTGLETKIPMLYELEFLEEKYMENNPCIYCHSDVKKHIFKLTHNKISEYCKFTRATKLPISCNLGDPWVKVISKKQLNKFELAKHYYDTKTTPEPQIALYLLGIKVK